MLYWLSYADSASFRLIYDIKDVQVTLKFPNIYSICILINSLEIAF